jgi:hypothetical protein
MVFDVVVGIFSESTISGIGPSEANPNHSLAERPGRTGPYGDRRSKATAVCSRRTTPDG